jgi:hypothetical protein
MPDTSIPSSFPRDPSLEQVFTPDLAEKQGWELVDELNEWRTYRRHKALERMHYCITHVHTVQTLTILVPQGPRY